MYFLGVDSGGTKTAFLLADENGTVHAGYRGGSGGFLSKGREGITELISHGLAEICKQAGIQKSGITFAGLGFPGYGEREGSEAAILAACEDAVAPGKVVCECDSYVAWAGSLAMEPGVNVIAGTGSNCYGINEAGESARASGWGANCDEGSCSWIGGRLIQIWTKQSDGRIPRTILYDMFRKHFNIENDTYFIHPLNRDVARGPEKAKLQLLVEEMYKAGDPYAAAIYKEAAAELALTVHAVAKKLGWEGTRYNASYSGGLFKAGECVINPLREAVAANGGKLNASRFTPEQGACLMAMRAYNPKADFTSLTFK